MENTSILIVDDEVSFQEGLKLFLEDEGYDVHQGYGGREGLSLFDAVNPELVVTDLRMPEMSGIDMIREIRKRDCCVPIIAVTGYGTLRSAIEAIRLGIFDFITKPVDLDAFKDTLDRAKFVLHAAQDVQDEVATLREKVALFQAQWREQSEKILEMEPLISTGRLFAGILHNLNNPLTYIMGQAELLKVLHPDVDNIRKIQEQAVRMRRIMETVLKKVRDFQSKEISWVQLNDILREEIEFLDSHPYFKMKIVKVWDLDDELPMVRGIPADFSQVLGNILRNAAEALSGVETKRLILKSWSHAGNAYIRIQDSGPGIPSLHLPRVFDLFFSTKTDKVGLGGSLGMGIGLYHCQELMKQYGGKILAENAPEGGAAFTVRIPSGMGTALDRVKH